MEYFSKIGNDWLVVSTRLKNISQIGNLPQIGVKINKYLKPPPRSNIGVAMILIVGLTSRVIVQSSRLVLR